MRLIPLTLCWYTVGLDDEDKPVELSDTAATDTVDTDTEDSDTQTDTDTQPDSENPYNGECSDNIDNDGDGRVDCNDSDCAAAPECNESSDGDTDGDGYLDDDDCDPYNPYVNPGATEIDNNGLDDDCDGTIDSGTSSGGGSNGGGNGNGGNPVPGTVCSDTCTDGLGNILYGANDGNCQDGGYGDWAGFAIGTPLCSFGTDCSDCGIRVDADGDFHEDNNSMQLPGAAHYADCDDELYGKSRQLRYPIMVKMTIVVGLWIIKVAVHYETTTTNNGTDDDADGDVDCDDSDCTSDPACSSSSNCSSGQVEDYGNCVGSSWWRWCLWKTHRTMKIVRI